MKNFKQLCVLSLALLFTGCFKVESDPLEVQGGYSDSCSFSYHETISLPSTDMSSNFIKEDPSVSYSITNSNCSGLQNQSGSGKYKWVNRIGNTFSFAADDPDRSEHAIYNLTANSTSFQSVSSSSCNYYGEKLTQTLTSSSINNTNKTITLNFSGNVVYSGCSSYSATINYYSLSLSGVYKSTCNNGVIKWQYFWQNSVGEMTYYYSNADCTGTKLMYIERNGVFAHRSGGGTLKEIDISYHNYLVKIFDTTLKNDFNSNSVCSISNWTTNIDFNVAGKNCNFNLLTDAPDKNFTSSSEQIFEKIYASSSTLYMGDKTTGDGSSSSNRPTTHDSSFQFTRDYSIVVKPDWTL